jgi:hypothetical protein
LMFLPWWAFAFLLQAAVRKGALVSVTPTRRRRAALTVAGTLLVVGGVVLASRFAQRHMAGAMLAKYLSAPRSPLAVTTSEAGADRVLMTTPHWSSALSPGAPVIATDLLAVRFRSERCSSPSVSLTVRYDQRRSDANLSTTMIVPTPPGTQPTAFVPVYDWADEYIRFRGFELKRSHAACVEEIARVRGLEHEPLLLTMKTGAVEREGSLYQRLQ